MVKLIVWNIAKSPSLESFESKLSKIPDMVRSNT